MMKYKSNCITCGKEVERSIKVVNRKTVCFTCKVEKNRIYNREKYWSDKSRLEAEKMVK